MNDRFSTFLTVPGSEAPRGVVPSPAGGSSPGGDRFLPFLHPASPEMFTGRFRVPTENTPIAQSMRRLMPKRILYYNVNCKDTDTEAQVPSNKATEATAPYWKIFECDAFTKIAPSPKEDAAAASVNGFLYVSRNSILDKEYDVLSVLGRDNYHDINKLQWLKCSKQSDSFVFGTRDEVFGFNTGRQDTGRRDTGRRGIVKLEGSYVDFQVLDETVVLIRADGSVSLVTLNMLERAFSSPAESVAFSPVFKSVQPMKVKSKPPVFVGPMASTLGTVFAGTSDGFVLRVYPFAESGHNKFQLPRRQGVAKSVKYLKSTSVPHFLVFATWGEKKKSMLGLFDVELEGTHASAVSPDPITALGYIESHDLIVTGHPLQSEEGHIKLWKAFRVSRELQLEKMLKIPFLEIFDLEMPLAREVAVADIVLLNKKENLMFLTFKDIEYLLILRDVCKGIKPVPKKPSCLDPMLNLR